MLAHNGGKNRARFFHTKIQYRDNMGALNIASYGLLIGAMGQFFFYKGTFPHFPAWIVWGVLFVPWLTVFTISFCNRPLFGPRPFRLCLLVAMFWYALLSVVAEGINFLIHAPVTGHVPFAVARVLMYFGFLSFVVLIRACITLRRYEIKQDAK
jgi:hypothetical protein